MADATQNPMSSEQKLTIGAGGVGLLTMLLDFVKDSPNSKLSDPVLITLICCMTAVVISYNVSRGLAKYEYRGLPAGTSPPSEHVPSGPVTTDATSAPVSR